MAFQLVSISMTLDDPERPKRTILPYIAFFRGSIRCLKVNEVEPHYQRQRDSPSSVNFSNVKIVHKFAGSMTLDFKVTIFFNVKYLENGTR